jgi:3-oxoacyl-[acyl-carrier protein] reductase
MLLKNKTAIITGSNKGIGKVILELFVENGANVVACARKETQEFVNALEVLKKKYNVSIIPVYFDLEDSEQIKSAVKSIISLKLRIDILVNNAGYASGAYFQMTPIVDLERIIKINFTSQIQFTQGISRYMARFNSGSIINMGSTAGLLGDAGMLSYGSSKAALMFSTKTMATELGSSNIRVNVIAPSVTKTEMFDQMDANARLKLIGSSALKRAAEPIEVANVALFLASDLSTFVNGQIIRVDGGITY